MAEQGLDPDDSRSPYRQVAEQLRRKIVEGEYAAGDKLPSRRELCEIFGVAPMTAENAVRELRTAGLVVSRKGSGVYVRTHPGRTSVPVGEVENLVDEIENRIATYATLSGTATATDIIERVRALLMKAK
ncbi:GntR family transcriptional regulator [Amycolatopsis minnesotensis]